MVDDYALATSALLAIFCASLCNLPPHNAFLDHYYYCAQSGEIVFRPRVFFKTNVDVGVLAVIPRGGFRRLQRSKFSRGVLNTTKMLPVLLIQLFCFFKIRCSGDVETNPGYVPECTTQPQS